MDPNSPEIKKLYEELARQVREGQALQEQGIYIPAYDPREQAELDAAYAALRATKAKQKEEEDRKANALRLEQEHAEEVQNLATQQAKKIQDEKESQAKKAANTTVAPVQPSQLQSVPSTSSNTKWLIIGITVVVVVGVIVVIGIVMMGGDDKNVKE